MFSFFQTGTFVGPTFSWEIKQRNSATCCELLISKQTIGILQYLKKIQDQLPKINIEKISWIEQIQVRKLLENTQCSKVVLIGLSRPVRRSVLGLSLSAALSTTQCLAVMRFTPHPPFSIISFWPENQTPATIYNYFPVPGARTPCPGANDNNQLISINSSHCNIKNDILIHGMVREAFI